MRSQIRIHITALLNGSDEEYSVWYTCWIDTDEEVPGGVHEVEMVGVVDPADRTGEHKAQVEVTLVLIQQNRHVIEFNCME